MKQWMKKIGRLIKSYLFVLRFDVVDKSFELLYCQYLRMKKVEENEVEEDEWLYNRWSSQLIGLIENAMKSRCLLLNRMKGGQWLTWQHPHQFISCFRHLIQLTPCHRLILFCSDISRHGIQWWNLWCHRYSFVYHERRRNLIFTPKRSEENNFGHWVGR